jgi:hypothetical protein
VGQAIVTLRSFRGEADVDAANDSGIDPRRILAARTPGRKKQTTVSNIFP